MSPPPPGRSGLRNRPLLLAGAALVGILLVLLWWLFRAEASPRVPRDSSGVVAQPQAVNESPAVLPQVAAPAVQPLPQAAPADVPALVPSAAPADARPTGSLLVRVRWSDGTPAADVGVRIVDGGHLTSTSPVLGTTDARGEARFASVLTGVVFIVTNRGSFTMAEGSGLQVVHLKAGTEQTVELTLPTGASVAGRVLDEAGRGIEGAAVSVVENENFQGWNTLARTDERGEFALHHVPSHASLFAWAPGFAESAQHDLTAWAPQEVVEIVLVAPCGQVAGTVRNADGAPVAGAALTLPTLGGWALQVQQTRRILSGPPRMTVVSDAQGRFRFESVPVGTTTLGVHAAGYALQEHSLDVVATSDTRVDVVLAPGCVVTGRATDASGRPVAGVMVLYDPTEHLLWGSLQVWCDAQGDYRLAELPAGTLALSAEDPRVGKDEASVTVAVGEPATWNPVLRGGTALQGLVLGRSGEPLEGVWVTASTRGDDVLQARQLTACRTDPNGAFTLLNIELDTLDLSFRPEDARYSALVLRDQPKWTGQRVFAVPWTAGRANVLRGRLVGRIDKAGGELGLAFGRADERGLGRIDGLGRDGRFELRDLPDGAYVLGVGLGTIEVLRLPVQLEGGTETDLGDLLIAFGTARVRPSFIGFAEGETPLDGLLAELRNSDGGRRPIRMMRQEDGFLAETLPPGAYELTVSGPGIATVRRALSVSADATEDVVVDVHAGASITIQVCGPAVESAGSGEILLSDATGTVLASTSGKPWEGCLYLDAGLLPGSYRCVVRTNGAELLARDITVTAEARQQFDFTLP